MTENEQIGNGVVIYCYIFDEYYCCKWLCLLKQSYGVDISGEVPSSSLYTTDIQRWQSPDGLVVVI